MKTYIPGKEAALEDSIENFLAQLGHHDIPIKEVSWLNPVPYVWSVHIQHAECPLCFSNGKGASKKAALASALGEFFERLATQYFFSDFYLGKTTAESKFVHYPDEKWITLTKTSKNASNILGPALWQFYDPHNELNTEDLIDKESCNIARGICTLPFEQVSTGKTVYVPVNILANLYASNGMAAGNSKYEARVQALSEILERFIKNKIISEAISLPEIPLNILASYPQIEASLRALEENGFPVYCFDASLGGRYPVICVVLLNTENGGCYASFGAHPKFEIALERTVTELLQGRSLSDLSHFSPPSFDNDAVADLTNLETHFIDSSGIISWDLFRKKPDYDFVHWNVEGNIETEYRALLSLVQSESIDVLIRDYTHLGIYVCRILAVTMSEIYPPEDILIANNNMILPLRDQLLALPNSAKSPAYYLSLIEQLDAENIDDFARLRELLGLAPNPGDVWHTVRIGELKAMLALAGGDLAQAQLWVDWTLEFNASTFTEERLKDYRCLQTLLDFTLNRDPDDLDNYRPTFEMVYGTSRVTHLCSVLTGKIRFSGLYPIDESLSQLPIHHKLLAVHSKLQAISDAHRHQIQE